MVIVRSLRKGRYFIAFFLTAAVFIIGILLGFLVSDYRSSSIDDVTKSQRLDYDSLQLQYVYINAFLKENNCEAAMKALDKNLNDLELTRLKLEAYLSSPVSDKKDLNILKREYLLAEVRYWLFLKQTEGVCEDTDRVSVLYFYSNEDCPDCVTQGVILTYLKDKLEERFLVFALDYNFGEEPLIDILKDSYNITSVPSIVVQNKSYPGLKTEGEILSIICGYYKVIPEGCVAN